MSTYRAVWPIAVVRPMRQLVDEAAGDLPAMLRLAHVRLTSTPHWSILPAVDVPGSGRVSDWCLVVTADAEPVPRPVDPPFPEPVKGTKGQLTKASIAELLEAGIRRELIVERLGLARRTVDRYAAQIRREAA